MAVPISGHQVPPISTPAPDARVPFTAACLTYFRAEAFLPGSPPKLSAVHGEEFRAPTRLKYS